MTILMVHVEYQFLCWAKIYPHDIQFCRSRVSVDHQPLILLNYAYHFHSSYRTCFLAVSGIYIVGYFRPQLIRYLALHFQKLMVFLCIGIYVQSFPSKILHGYSFLSVTFCHKNLELGQTFVQAMQISVPMNSWP